MRNILCVLLMPFAFASLLLLGFSYFLCKGCYNLSKLADGRKNLQSFDAYIYLEWEIGRDYNLEDSTRSTLGGI